MTEKDYALQDAQAWTEDTTKLYEAFTFCSDERMEAREISRDARRMLRKDFAYDGDNREQCLGDIEEHCREGVLSVEVRSGWYILGDAPDSPDEFQILLTTGGPALRILGNLDCHGEPRRVWLEWQDWGTPWQEVRCCDNEILLWFAGLFYYGEG